MKNRYDLFGLAVFLFYPIIVMALAEIPYKMIFKRTLVTLPFVFFCTNGADTVSSSQAQPVLTREMMFTPYSNV